jgi:hypothetical protein
VQEHEGDESEDLLKGGEVGADFRHGITGGNKAVDKDELILPWALHHLDEEQENIRGNEQGVDHRIVSGTCCVANGDHGRRRALIIVRGCDFSAICGEGQNPKSEARNSKWFDQLTTLSHVEGQYPMIQIPMTKTGAAAFLF